MMKMTEKGLSMTTNEVAKKWLEKLENPRRWERELEFNFGDDFLS